MKETQQQKILAHLQDGKSITQMEALRRYGCFRLGARIHNLKRQGVNIVSRLVSTPDGKKFSEYRLSEDTGHGHS